MGPRNLLSLDTNVLVDWIRQDRRGQYLRATYHLESLPNRPLFSTIVEGELRGLARRWNWGERKLSALDDILAQLVRIDAGAPEVVLSYAELYEADARGGHNTGENDLWIAASTKAAGASLLTRDDDCLWMHPDLVSVEYVQPPEATGPS